MTNISLSPREQKILFSLSKGNLYKEIAVEHEISVNTVKKHLKSIYRKMNVHKRSHAADLYLSDQAASS